MSKEILEFQKWTKEFYEFLANFVNFLESGRNVAVFHETDEIQIEDGFFYEMLQQRVDVSLNEILRQLIDVSFYILYF